MKWFKEGTGTSCCMETFGLMILPQGRSSWHAKGAAVRSLAAASLLRI